MTSCEGVGRSPREIVVQSEPGVRDLRNGRGVCPVCTRILALNIRGKMIGHGKG